MCVICTYECICAYVHMCLHTCGLHNYTCEMIRAWTRRDECMSTFHHNYLTLGKFLNSLCFRSPHLSIDNKNTSCPAGCWATGYLSVQLCLAALITSSLECGSMFLPRLGILTVLWCLLFDVSKKFNFYYLMQSSPVASWICFSLMNDGDEDLLSHNGSSPSRHDYSRSPLFCSRVVIFLLVCWNMSDRVTWVLGDIFLHQLRIEC